MFRRNAFVLVVLLALIVSAAFTSWTQDNLGSGKKTPGSGKSFPPDTTDYARPAVPSDTALSKTAKGLSAPGFFVVEVPNSAGGEPDIAINPTNLNQIVVHGGFGGWNGNAPNEISNDGGLTWNQVFQIPPPPGAPNTAGCPCDITHDWGMDGNLYGTYLTGNTDVFSASNSNPIFGGLFSYFLVAGNAQLTDFNGTLGGADQPQLLTNADPTTLTQTDTYVAYSDFGVSPPNERVSAAPNSSPPDFTADNVAGVSTAVGGCVINPGHRLATDPRTGAVYSLYQTCPANNGFNQTIGYKLNRSLDGGTTWTLNGSATGILVSTNVTVQAFAAKFGTVNALFGGIDAAAVNPTTGNVFVVYGGDNGTVDPITGHDGNAIFIRQITFDNSSPTMAIVGAQHQVSMPGAQAAMPSVAVAPNGTVGVLYTSFDGFSVDGFPIFSGHFASSTDAGASFTDQTLLTFLSPAKASGVPNDKQRVLGDYQQLKVVNDPPPASAGANFYGVFTGNGAALGNPIANNDAIFFKVALAPQINLNPNPLAIGPVCLGSTGTGKVEVADTGADNLLISSITRTSGSADISLATGPTFPVNISPDANFNFTFTCTPTTVGAKSATFNIASNDPASPNTPVTVTCSTGSGTINVTGSGDFGTASCSGTTPPQTLKINNVGTCNLDVVSAVISCPDFTLVNPSEFPATISPDSGLDVGVKFTPTSGGPKSCNLTITTDDPINPVVVIPLTGNTALGTASLTFPTGITFPPTVIQESAACSATLGVPIANSGTCPVQINSVGLTQTSVSPPGLDYSLTGLPTLPLSVPAGGQLGSGDLDLVFAPFAIAQFSTGTVDVTFVNDPITGTLTTTHVPFCGEGVRRGLRVLVTLGGVPVSGNVKRILLQQAFGPEQQSGIFTIRTIKNATLQTVTGIPPCPTFSFHGDFGDIANTYQLKDGTYRIKVELKVGKKLKTKVVRVNMDECTFTPNVVVAF